ncbi:hypothetical protein [Nostoc sp.]|uniref:hypothetical protein n=1 Tax=Nostoc sp. TaxID=1180 RepID=UPI002FFCDA85
MELVPSLQTGNKVTQAFRLFLVPFDKGLNYKDNNSMSVGLKKKVELKNGTVIFG